MGEGAGYASFIFFGMRRESMNFSHVARLPDTLLQQLATKRRTVIAMIRDPHVHIDGRRVY